MCTVIDLTARISYYSSGDQYKVVTFTGPEKGAGTKSKIYIVLYGEDGKTQEKELKFDPSNKDAFAAGK